MESCIQGVETETKNQIIELGELCLNYEEIEHIHKCIGKIYRHQISKKFYKWCMHLMFDIMA